MFTFALFSLATGKICDKNCVYRFHLPNCWTLSFFVFFSHIVAVAICVQFQVRKISPKWNSFCVHHWMQVISFVVVFCCWSPIFVCYYFCAEWLMNDLNQFLLTLSCHSRLSYALFFHFNRLNLFFSFKRTVKLICDALSHTSTPLFNGWNGNFCWPNACQKCTHKWTEDFENSYHAIECKIVATDSALSAHNAR